MPQTTDLAQVIREALFTPYPSSTSPRTRELKAHHADALTPAVELVVRKWHEEEVARFVLDPGSRETNVRRLEMLRANTARIKELEEGT